MGQEFLENLWGWQVTRPDLIQNWAWDEVKSVYFDDARQLGLPHFLAQGPNAHVKAHMLALFMVAAEKGYWKADPATIRQMGTELAKLVARNGLPGSGHTAPHHPMWQWLLPQLEAADAQSLGVTLARARGEFLPSAATGPVAAPPGPQARKTAAAAAAHAPSATNGPTSSKHYELSAQPLPSTPTPGLAAWQVFALSIMGLPLFALGLWRGRALPR